MNDDEFITCKDKNGYPWVYIVYDGHEAFACDWRDCLEEIIFLYGHELRENYIKYDDPKLQYFKHLYIKNSLI